MMYNIFDGLYMFGMILILGIVVVAVFQAVHTWHTNNQSPLRVVSATVITKRAETYRYDRYKARIRYYATFQLDDGHRMEFKITGKEYGMLVEGDIGHLTFQGTRYLKFYRE